MIITRTTLRTALCAAIAAIAIGSAPAPLQAQTDAFQFGPPLRKNIVFAYKYTERVRTWHTSAWNTSDSSERILTYFITQRQLARDGGLVAIEANIDSMRVEFRRDGDTLLFDTQKLVGVDFDITHREILGPSSIVNRVTTFTLSPYGEVIKVEGSGIENIREQVQDPAVDKVTRERVLDITTPEYLTAVFLPWRGLLPVGRSLAFGDTIETKFGTALDRVPVGSTAAVALTKVYGKPALTFTASLSNPVRTTSGFTEILEPVSIKSVRGRIAGMLNLDDDGVVLSGWTTQSGVIESETLGVPLVTKITQETQTEMLGMMPFAAN